MKMNSSIKYSLAFGLGLDKDGVAIGPVRKDNALKVIREAALRLLGGYQIHFAEGGWRSDTGRDFTETCLILTTTQPEGFDESRLEEVAHLGKGSLNQECVYVEATPVRSGFLF